MTAILFLHGGGHSDHTRYAKLQEKFAQEGIVTRAFDHHATSLTGRLQEAEKELESLKLEHGLSDTDIIVWGSSMGGHIACRLVESHPDIKALILQSAAAYSREAEDISFGPDFTAEISRNNSWENSPAFKAVEEYVGPVLVIYGELDDVIPNGVKSRYIARTEQKREHITLAGVGHTLLRPRNEKEFVAWDVMYAASLDFVKKFS